MKKLLCIIGFHEGEVKFGRKVKKYFEENFPRYDIEFYEVKNKSPLQRTEKSTDAEVANKLSVLEQDIFLDIHCSKPYDYNIGPLLIVLNNKFNLKEKLEKLIKELNDEVLIPPFVKEVSFTPLTSSGGYQIAEVLSSRKICMIGIEEFLLKGGYHKKIKEAAEIIAKIYDMHNMAEKK